MRLIPLETPDEVGRWAAQHIVRRIQAYAPDADNPFVLGLPTGETPLLTYQYLIQAYREGRISFQHVVTFNMDEYVGLPRTDPASYYQFMHERFFRHINIPPRNIHLLDGTATDIEELCRDYERRMQAFGGVELFMGGVGSDGHIAFNEPGSSLASRTRVKTLTEETRAANARFFGDDITKVPTQALTVGIQTLLDAREVMILAHGRNKAQALQVAVEGSVSHTWPVSALQMHPNAMIVCDQIAVGELKVKTLAYFSEIEKNDLLIFRQGGQ